MDVTYKIGDTVLGTTVKEKDLGLTISADIKVSEQCGIAASKGNNFLRSVQLPVKPFQPNKLHIYIQCSLQQDSPDTFGRLVLFYFLFAELRQTLEIELSRLPHQLCTIHSRHRKISKKYSFIST